MQIVQCYDDGISDDIRLTEILRRYGATASFNLNMGLHGENRSEPWSFKGLKEVFRLSKGELREVYDGFLVANHSLTHPHLEQISPEDARLQIAENRAEMEEFFGYEVKGFAYPFGSYNETVQEIVRDTGHLYARTVHNVAQAFPPADPTAFHPTCHFLAADFWDKFEAVKAVGGVFYFWGHSYELVTDDDWAEFESKIARIAAEPTAKWTTLPELFI